MNIRLRRMAVGVLSILVMSVQPVIAGQLLKAKELACGGTGPQEGQITATERQGTLTIKVKGKNLTPGEAATCGYTCGMVFTSGPVVPCGTVSESGRLSGKVDLALATCFGFIPFFNTPTTGKCVASTIP